MSSPPELMTVRVRPWTLALLWLGMAAFYAVCATVLALQGLVHIFVRKYAEVVVIGVELLGVNVQRGLFPYMAAASLAIASIHVYYLTGMILRSLKARSFVFSTRASTVIHTTGTKKTGRPKPLALAVLSPLQPHHASLIWRVSESIVGIALAVWRSFDVTSPNYGVVYFIRELVQTGIQTQQAYRLSAHVAKAGMSHTIVVLLIVNCWAMPLIKYVLRVRSLATTRLLSVIVNLVLDFVSTFAIPVALFLPYARDFNQVTGTFDQHFWYTDTWLFQLPNVWPLLFATSLWDGVSRLFIAFGMTRTLRSVAKLLQPPALRAATAGTTIVRDETAFVSAASIVPFRSKPTSSKHRLSRSLSRLPPPPVLRSRTELWGHRFLGLWGLVIFALHVHSSSMKENTQCLVQVRPWLVRRPVCSVMEINCIDDKLTGSAADFDATIDSIDNLWLSYLVIRHCKAVEITPRVKDLSWLHALKIFNSTLVRWNDDAALTQTNHPNMLIVFVVSSNVTEFPRALYNRDFPAKLMDIEFSNVNLTSLPDEIADLWLPGMFLVMEGLQFPSFPPVLAKLQPWFFAATCNNYSEIPAAVFENPILQVLNLNGNPIREIPPGPLGIKSLYIVGTKIAAIPTWLDVGSVGIELLAGSTPMCGALQDNNFTAVGLGSVAELGKWQQYTNCTPADQYYFISHYPLPDEATNNPSKISHSHHL